MRRALLPLALLSGCADWDTLAADARCKVNPSACAGPSAARWPDSATVRCTNGSVEVDPCPSPGQTAFGQDGNYLLRVPAYAQAGLIIHDSVTGLDWETASTNSDQPWSQAVSRCNALQTEARTWRLPSRLELASLLDFGGGRAFAGLHRGAHWTSSPAPGADTAWKVDFLDVRPVVGSTADTARGLCVSGPAMESAFTTDGELLRDALTGLEWQRSPPAQWTSWVDALSQCEALELAGRTDWRLPSGKEWLTLGRDDEQAWPGLEGRVGENYWASSPDNVTTHSRTIGFPDGTVSANDASLTGLVRCVRGPD